MVEQRQGKINKEKEGRIIREEEKWRIESTNLREKKRCKKVEDEEKFLYSELEGLWA